MCAAAVGNRLPSTGQAKSVGFVCTLQMKKFTIIIIIIRYYIIIDVILSSSCGPHKSMTRKPVAEADPVQCVLKIEPLLIFFFNTFYYSTAVILVYINTRTDGPPSPEEIARNKI